MQRNTILGVVVLGVMLSGAATVVLAHHSMSAKYDIGKTIAIEGTLTEVAWGNPHTWLFLDAKPVGQPDAPVRNWVIEAPGATGMVRVGWQKDTISAGHKVTLTGHPHKQGKAEMVLVELNDEDGHHFRVGVRLPYGEASTPAPPTRPE